MSGFTVKRHSLLRAVRVVVLASVAALVGPVLAQPKPVTMETLLDRIQVEDVITRYYYDLSLGKGHDLSNYFTADAVLDVDGMVAHGPKEIEELYAPDPNAKPAPKPKGYRRGNMLLTNPIIEVNGNTATAHVIWTGVMNNGVGKAPMVTEQGREDTVLVKRDGKWLISARCISSDSGLPDKFDATWKAREHC
ncbi:MAG TPA: nuclear transport factor 2 family protein [Candidatus Acidoferrum sp.]|nr:nuclear transport factor 2 family protein [Candidatus Acidoferrum sp.]